MCAFCVPNPHAVFFFSFSVPFFLFAQAEIQSLIDVEFTKLTERYYRASAWPHAASIAPIVDDDATTILLYNELFYRHIYAKTAVTVEERIKSFKNYVELFNVILGLSEEPEFDLPVSWLWEMIDGFVEQFHLFHVFRSKNKAHTPHEQVHFAVFACHRLGVCSRPGNAFPLRFCSRIAVLVFRVPPVFPHLGRPRLSRPVPSRRRRC